MAEKEGGGNSRHFRLAMTSKRKKRYGDRQGGRVVRRKMEGRGRGRGRQMGCGPGRTGSTVPLNDVSISLKGKKGRESGRGSP